MDVNGLRSFRSEMFADESGENCEGLKHLLSWLKSFELNPVEPELREKSWTSSATATRVIFS